MNKKHDYISGKQLTRRSNGKVFVDQSAIDGTTFDLTATEVTDVGKLWATFNTEVDAGIALDALKEAQTVKTNAADNAYVAKERTLASRMKESAAYKADVAGVGNRYMIIGDEKAIDAATSKPALAASKVPSGWALDFNLLAFFTGVKIYRKRPTDADFSYIATDLSAPYIDTDKQVSGTQYMAYYIIADTAVGLQSDAVTVQV